MINIKIYYFIIKTDILYPPLPLFICCKRSTKGQFQKEKKNHNAFLVA